MPKLSGGQAVVRALAAEGVRAVFGIPGVHNLDIYDALIDTPGIKHIVVRHEQGASFMADGFARATGEVGVLILTTGPGLTNALTGIAQAYSDSTPMLVLSAQVPVPLVDRERGYLHELRDQLGVARPVTLYNQRVGRVEDIMPAIASALACIRKGRPRPIHLDLPFDVLEGTAEVGEHVPALPPCECARPAPDPALIRRGAHVIARAERPLILAGGGATAAGAGQELIALAELLQAPIMLTGNGKGSVPEDHPLVLGNLGMDDVTNDVLRQADALLAFGTRFSSMTTRGFTWPVPSQLVHVDVDPAELGRNYPATVAITADARLGAAAMLDELKGLVTAARPARASEVAALRAKVVPGPEAQAPWELVCLRTIRKVLAPDDILVNDMTFLSYAAARFYQALKPRTIMHPRGYGTLGFSYPAALGAQVGQPDRRVLSISGDGGFLFSGTELATAMQYNLPVVALVVNNQGYGMVKRIQTRKFGRSVDVDLHTPDYVKLAQAFGMASERIDGHADLEAALQRGFSERRPYLIEMIEPRQ
jgi:acetolactate synthase-1/2/3 large subunit